MLPTKEAERKCTLQGWLIGVSSGQDGVAVAWLLMSVTLTSLPTETVWELKLLALNIMPGQFTCKQKRSLVRMNSHLPLIIMCREFLTGL